MEGLVREMQDPETGVPVRSQKIFLTSIPSAFMGFDLIEWLMDRLNIEESVEAVHLANQLCQYGYFFPVSDSKNLIVKDDSSLYRFQTPYYWPWQHRMPDNVEYAIYLCKRTLRNKQRHGLEEYELEALTSLKKNLANKWDFITMQAEEQVRLAKERKKGDKIVSDSQDRAYWRVYRPPPGYLNCLEPAPVPSWNRGGGSRAKKRSIQDLNREVDFLRSCLVRTRVKVSQAVDNLIQYSVTFNEYDPFFLGALPSNPWVTDDSAFWQFNSPLVECPTEKRVRRWGLSMEELVSDPTGLQEFTNYLRKEYSHENIRFWIAVNDLRRSAQSQIHRKVSEIFDEFLAPGAPCEINIDGKTMERVHQELRSPSRFTFDSAAEHVYTLLLKKDCYPRFIRSEHYKNLRAAGIQPSIKKRFFVFGGQARKKTSTCNAPNPAFLQQQQQSAEKAGVSGGGGGGGGGGGVGLGRRRGSDRSLSGSVHELAVSGVREVASRVAHSHSQSNLSEIPYRDPPAGTSLDEGGMVQAEKRANTENLKDDVCPWETPAEPPATSTQEQQLSESDSEIPQNNKKKKSISVVASSPSTIPEVPQHSESDAETTAAASRGKKSSISNAPPSVGADTCPWDSGPSQSFSSRKNSSQMDSGSSSSDVSIALEVSEKLRKSCSIQQPTPSSSSATNPPTDVEKIINTAPPEEKVIARIQNVRKYSTTSIGRPLAESRRSSVTTKILESATRPSVSSPEDFTVMVGTSTESSAVMVPSGSDRYSKADEPLCLRTYKKSSSSVGRKRSSVSSSTAPVISVSSVVDETVDNTSCQTLPKTAEIIPEKSESEVTTAGTSCKLQSEGSIEVSTSWQEMSREPKGRKANEICPWEDE
ncbi:Regulator of G-protein signaling loco [Gryllus bimaculatus]|nr:Regulator of G-protein signaling loco [Gryllus bimaculatus]